MDLATRKLAKIGVAAGIVSSQSLGEPATQLTMRSFHADKNATEEDVTQGVKRVEELLEVRKPKRSAIIAPFDGVVKLEEK